MSKVKFVIEASESSLNEKTASILLCIAKTNFISPAEIRTQLPEINASSVNSNIGVLIKKGLIEKSDTGLIVSESGHEIILKAASLFGEENPSKIRKTRKPRGTTEQMQKDVESLKLLVEEIAEVKGIFENRSNLEVRLSKRHKGIRQFEIRQSVIRIFGYKISEELCKIYTDIGCTIKSKNNNFYIDIDNTEANMKAIVESSK